MDHALNALLRSFAEKKERHHQLKQESDAASAAYRTAEQDVLDKLEELGLKTLTVELPGQGTVRFTARKPTIYGRIEDPELALASFENMARVDELFHPKVQERRLNEFVREELEAGRELPPGVGFYEKPGVTVSKLK